MQPERGESLNGRLELLRKYYKDRPVGQLENHREVVKSQGSFPSLHPRFKLALALFMALTVGNLPEFSIPGLARLNVFCSEEGGERRITVDATHLRRKIDRGAISLVYRRNPQRGDLVAIFPYENSLWRESSLDLPYHTPATSPHRESVGDTFSIHQGFVRPEDVDSNSGILDKGIVTEECFQRTVK